LLLTTIGFEGIAIATSTKTPLCLPHATDASVFERDDRFKRINAPHQLRSGVVTDARRRSECSGSGDHISGRTLTDAVTTRRVEDSGELLFAFGSF